MPQLGYEDVILTHGKSVCLSRSPEYTDISAKLGKHTFKVPVCMTNMPAVQTWDILKQFDDNNWFYVYHRMGGPDDVFLFAKSANEEFNITSISVGVKPEWVELVQHLHADKIHVDFFTVDVALSYNDNVLPILSTIFSYYPESTVIVGNGCTPEWIKWLDSMGVDCAKVGIGTSKVCSTRQFTGFGSSTITSVRDCAEAVAASLFNDKMLVMSDGGIRVNSDGMPFVGDITLALAVGKADWVMSGALFKCCTDSPAVLNGYFGNSTEDAKGHSKHVEGRKMSVQSNDKTIKEMMNLIEDSLRSAVSYSGGRNIEEMKQLAKWEVVK